MEPTLPDRAGEEVHRRHVDLGADRDEDGVVDREDLCPDVPAGSKPDPKRAGCPAADDRDGDGVVDDKDECIDVPAGRFPIADKPGCPADRDGDDVIDEKDRCVDVPAGDKPDPKKAGCPLDTDKDGVPDDKDECVYVPRGKLPDPARNGCPLDTDKDGVFDTDDKCVDVPQGLNPDPDPEKKGCPLPDGDGDNIVDLDDACPDKPGAPDPDRAKNGCPGLVQISGCSIQINQPVFFATDKDVILPKSFAVLQAVGNALKLSPQIKRVSIEGHTDNQGKLEHNMELSDRRAKSVRTWLTTKGGIEEERLEAQGYGPQKPLADNASPAGRAQNRRVEFRIVDPVCAEEKKP
jgi:outer membrane protein OmpA-like peptidoglycan-associated protein